MTKCIWCTREFEEHPTRRKSYDLENAGITICWDCADSYQQAFIKAKVGKLYAFLAPEGIITENGTKLPFTLSFGPKRITMTKVVAVDPTGHRWHGKIHNDQVTLRP